MLSYQVSVSAFKSVLIAIQVHYITDRNIVSEGRLSEGTFDLLLKE